MTETNLAKPGQGLLVIGVARPGKAPIFCYAQLLDRTSDTPYPPPLLPKDIGSLELDLTPIADGRIEIHTWERRLTDDEVAEVEATLPEGRLRIPADCPIEGGRDLVGPNLPRSFPAEGAGSLPARGAGVTMSSGFIVTDVVDNLIEMIGDATRPAVAARDLGLVLEALEEQSGMTGVFVSTRRLGVVECLRRPWPFASAPLLNVRPVKPDLRSKQPCRALTLDRTAAAPERDLIVALSTSAWKTTTAQSSLFLPATTGSVRFDSGGHYTDIDVRVFDRESGELLEEQHLSLTQVIDISMTMLGGQDILPTLFPSVSTADLEHRQRVHTGRTKGIDSSGRAPALDALNRNAAMIEMLIGPPSQTLESLFFPAGVDSQVAVIRWLKTHIEASNTAKAFLIDPYLGSQAFERVVLRQGHENVELSIVVSPANVDPDATNLDEPSCQTGGHIDTLVRCADSHASRLCGEISLVHVKRGGGNRQAFHDRYFGIVQHKGPPRVFLLSNSLSKAAGDWPFTIAEVDTPTAWEAVGYVGDITQAKSGKGTTAEVVWRSGAVGIEAGETAEAQPASTEFSRAMWAAYERVFPIMHGETVDVGAVVADLMRSVPPEVETLELAHAIIDGVHGRLPIAAAIADSLAGSGCNTLLPAAIDDAIVETVLVELAPRSGPPPQWIQEDATLLRVGRRLGQRSDGTLVVRNRLNPALHRYTHMMEQDRKGLADLQAVQTVLALSLIGLEIVSSAPEIPEKFRRGIAIDYLNTLGRILRSPATARLIRPDENPNLTHPSASVHRLVMRKTRDLAESLQGDVARAYQALATDPLIPADLVTPPEPKAHRYPGLESVEAGSV